MLNEKQLEEFAGHIIHAGGRAYFTGGYVRDSLMGRPPKDMDIEIFFLEEDEVEYELGYLGKVKKQGNFGVFVVEGLDNVEFTMPRTEKKFGPNHNDYSIALSPFLSIREAAMRRDFTMNAIYQDILTGDIVDPTNGSHDIKNRLIKPVSPQFGEDALRILRAYRFVSELGFKVHVDLLNWAEALEPEYEFITMDRVWAEWRKMILGPHFARAIAALGKTTWTKFYPEIYDLEGIYHGISTPDSEHHPEGDAYTHTLLALEYCVNEYTRLDTEHDRIILRLAVLLHDTGKVSTREIIGGKVTFYNHHKVSADKTEDFLIKIGVPNRYHDIYNKVNHLVKQHMAHYNFMGKITDRSVSRLAYKLHPATIQDWVQLVDCDLGGRPPLKPYLPERVYSIIHIAQRLEVVDNKPKNIVTGKFLIKHFEFPPGPQMGVIIDHAYDAQLEQMFSNETEAIEWVHSLFND